MKVYSYDGMVFAQEHEGELRLVKGRPTFVDKNGQAVGSWIYLYETPEAAVEAWKKREAENLEEAIEEAQEMIKKAEKTRAKLERLTAKSVEVRRV